LKGLGTSDSIKHRRTTAQEPKLKSGRWVKAVPTSSISTVLAGLRHASSGADTANGRLSAYIGAMPVFWLGVPGQSGPSNLRAFIERNAIALLSNHLDPVDKASDGWLGKSCPSKEVQRSGLWNVNHVDEDYDPRFLDDMEACVARTCQFAVATT
jgi:hypothetical protein